MNTGIQRSLTIIVTKKISNVVQPGYPISYNGRNAFSVGGTNYYAITIAQLADMINVDYNARLAAFKLYVQQVESGLNIDAVQLNSPFIENTTACPIS